MINDLDLSIVLVHAAERIDRAGIRKLRISADAPNDYQSLVQEYNRIGIRGEFRVSSSGINNSIYGDAMNHALVRAWHDLVHCENQLDFSLASEMRVVQLMIEEIKHKVQARTTQSIWIDLAGQVLMFHITDGKFVMDQKKFHNDMIDVLASTTMYGG